MRATALGAAALLSLAASRAVAADEPAPTMEDPELVLRVAPEPKVDPLPAIATEPWDDLADLADLGVVAPVLPERPDAGECLVMPSVACRTSPLFDLGMGWGSARSFVGSAWSYMGYVETGVLTELGLGSSLQLGPVVSLGFDFGGVTQGWTGAPKLRLRYWIEGGDFTLELAAGAAFERFAFNGGWEAGTRVGGTVDLGASYVGAIGPWVSLYALGDPGGPHDGELRALVGFRANLLVWGYVFGALGGAFGRPWF
ncbi:MAG: hypothetical protein IT373_36230 [Polyangiaceae bacterium]|nr:hypothetical protein [Polyangiaceae bacterium]